MNEVSPAKITLADLALTFLRVAIASFGGGLSAWSREVIVVERKWMNDEEFLSAVTICRILPGANQINMAVFVGAKFRGIPGAIAATVGLTLVPALIVLAMGWFYLKYREVPAFHSVLRGMTASAVGMTLSMAFKTGRKCLRGTVPVLLFAAMFLLAAIFRWPLLWSLAVLGPISVWWAWPRHAGEEKA